MGVREDLENSVWVCESESLLDTHRLVENAVKGIRLRSGHRLIWGVAGHSWSCRHGGSHHRAGG